MSATYSTHNGWEGLFWRLVLKLLKCTVLARIDLGRWVGEVRTRRFCITSYIRGCFPPRRSTQEEGAADGLSVVLPYYTHLTGQPAILESQLHPPKPLPSFPFPPHCSLSPARFPMVPLLTHFISCNHHHYLLKIWVIAVASHFLQSKGLTSGCVTSFFSRIYNPSHWLNLYFVKGLCTLMLWTFMY